MAESRVWGVAAYGRNDSPISIIGIVAVHGFERSCLRPIGRILCATITSGLASSASRKVRDAEPASIVVYPALRRTQLLSSLAFESLS